MLWENFVINDYITLKYEEESSNIYVNNEYFCPCAGHSILMLPTKLFSVFAETSLDNIIEILGDHIHDCNKGLTPKIDHWQNCELLKCWTTDGYPTTYLRMDLAFPLLEKLFEIGDPQAKTVFKEEIAKRFMSGYKPIMVYLVNEGYLRYLDSEMLDLLFGKHCSTAIERLLFLLDLIQENASDFFNKYQRFMKNSFEIIYFLKSHIISKKLLKLFDKNSNKNESLSKYLKNIIFNNKSIEKNSYDHNPLIIGKDQGKVIIALIHDFIKIIESEILNSLISQFYDKNFIDFLYYLGIFCFDYYLMNEHSFNMEE